MEEQTKANQPKKRYMAGGIVATVWENEHEKDGKKFSFQTVKLERVYKDDNDEWKNTNSFRVSDLPKATLVLDKAFQFLSLKDE